MNGEKGILFTQGNEACVRGALYAGLRFFAGYPITPSTEVAELLSEELPHVGGRFIQMEDEISSLCAVCAASVAGDKAMTAAPVFRSCRRPSATRSWGKSPVW